MAFDPEDPDTKAAVQALVDEATAGLAAKNRELLAELKEARKEKGVDPAELAAAQAALAAAQAEAQAARAEAAQTAEALAVETGNASKLLIENGLSAALARANVAPPFLPAVRALMAAQVTIAQDGEARRLMVGDKDLAAHIDAWAASDEAKHYLAAPLHRGGGAAAGRDAPPSAARIATRPAFEAMAPADRAAFLKDGGRVTDAA